MGMGVELLAGWTERSGSVAGPAGGIERLGKPCFRPGQLHPLVRQDRGHLALGWIGFKRDHGGGCRAMGTRPSCRLIVIFASGPNRVVWLYGSLCLNG